MEAYYDGNVLLQGVLLGILSKEFGSYSLQLRKIEVKFGLFLNVEKHKGDF